MVVLEHAAVSRVSDVEVVRGVHHDSVGPAQRVGTSCGGAARGSETAMAECEIGVRIASASLAAATVKRRMLEEQLTQTPVMLGLDSQRLLPRCSQAGRPRPRHGLNKVSGTICALVRDTYAEETHMCRAM